MSRSVGGSVRAPRTRTHQEASNFSRRGNARRENKNDESPSAVTEVPATETDDRTRLAGCAAIAAIALSLNRPHRPSLSSRTDENDSTADEDGDGDPAAEPNVASSTAPRVPSVTAASHPSRSTDSSDGGGPALEQLASTAARRTLAMVSARAPRTARPRAPPERERAHLRVRAHEPLETPRVGGRGEGPSPEPCAATRARWRRSPRTSAPRAPPRAGRGGREPEAGAPRGARPKGPGGGGRRTRAGRRGGRRRARARLGAAASFAARRDERRRGELFCAGAAAGDGSGPRPRRPPSSWPGARPPRRPRSRRTPRRPPRGYPRGRRRRTSPRAREGGGGEERDPRCRATSSAGDDAGEDDDGAGRLRRGGRGRSSGARTRGAARIGASSPTRRVRAKPGARRGVAVEEPGVEAVEAVTMRARPRPSRAGRAGARASRGGGGVRLVVAGPVEEVPTGRLAPLRGILAAPGRAAVCEPRRATAREAGPSRGDGARTR